MSKRQGKQPTIFLIEEDDETRRPLVRALREQGYRVIVSIDEENALETVEGGHIQADLMLIDLVGKSADEALDAGRRVREHVKYHDHMPLVVMPEKYGKDVEGTNVNVEVNDWIMYLGEEPGQLDNLIARLTSGTEL